jgi:hypothetical protein
MMKNLNEPHRQDIEQRDDLKQDVTTADIANKLRPKSEGSVLRFEQRQGPMGGDRTPLLPTNEVENLRGQWDRIQTTFVDEPRKSVEEADKLVASAIRRMAEVFSKERATLENSWSRGEQISTEDLRVALQHYRTFFSRLLNI